MRDYTILRLKYPKPLESELREALYRHPCLGLESTDHRGILSVRAYFAADFPLQDLRNEFCLRWPALLWEGETSIRLPTEDRGSPGLQTIRLSGHEIFLQGGSAFGNGFHPTTRLAASLLRGDSLQDKEVLDLGTGTGVLAILAKNLGARRVCAVEILPEARANALQNFRLNGCEDVPILEKLGDCADRFDVVVANILTPTLLALREPMLGRLKNDGVLFLSGMLAEERDAVLQEFRPQGIQGELLEAEWLALALRCFNHAPNESGSAP